MIIMTKEVQEFIEANLELIDQENWYQIFNKGYQQYTQYFWEEFITSLKLAGIDTKNVITAMKMNILDTIASEIGYCFAEDLLPMSLKAMINRSDVDWYVCDEQTVLEDAKKAFDQGYFSSNVYYELHSDGWIYLK